MKYRVIGGLVVSLLGLIGASTQAVSLGLRDDFQDGSTDNWASGANNPNPPFTTGGGPGGALDRFLMLKATGGVGSGSRLVVFNDFQWSGDYLAAGVTGIRMALDNLGSTDLELRLVFLGLSGASAVSTDAVVLSAGSGWREVQFSTLPLALTGSPLSALADVGELRLIHNTQPSLFGEGIVAQLGVDDITAVPEPDSGWMLVTGCAALVAGRGLRAAATRRPAA